MSVFEIFHQVFFPGGNYTFDPSTDRLVQLFPFAFWSETTIVVGAVIIALALALALVTGQRERAARPTVAPGATAAVTASRPEGAR